MALAGWMNEKNVSIAIESTDITGFKRVPGDDSLVCLETKKGEVVVIFPVSKIELRLEQERNRS